MGINGDFLNRNSMIDQIYNIACSSIEFKSPIAISLEGKWGIGKSWLLDMLDAKFKCISNENQTKVTSYESDYLVFKYNAWENDYFSEPLVAILTAFCSQINSTTIISNKLDKAAAKLTKKIIKESLELIELSISNISKKTLGFDLIKKGKALSKILKDIKDIDKLEITSDDKAIGISKDIENVVLALNRISRFKPIIFMVDELDRCIPDYAIKTLERFHHVFNKVNNSIVIVSVDKNQLERTVINMFGNGIDVNQYLKKFFKFSIEVNQGDFDEVEFLTRFESIIAKYLIMSKHDEELLYDFLKKLLPYYTAREKINILDKVLILHSLIETQVQQLGIDILLGELLLVVIKDGKDSKKYVYLILIRVMGTTLKITLKLF